MRVLAPLAVALAMAVVAALSSAQAGAPAACPVTIHVAGSGAMTLGNCKGAHETSDERFHNDLAALLKVDGHQDGPGLVIFDAEPDASLFSTMNAMNWAMDDGVEDFRIIDEQGRAAFTISMPIIGFPVPVVLPRDATQADIDRAQAAQPKPPHFISVSVRTDGLIDVALPSAPLRPEGRALVKPDPERPAWFVAEGVKIDDLPLLMPKAGPKDMSRVASAGQGIDKVRWREVRAIYRAFVGGGFGRLISEDASFL